MDVEFIFEKCGCQVRTSYGLPCAHEQFILVNGDVPLELELVDKFWKKLDLLECTSSEDNDLSYDIELSMLSAQFKSKSRFGKLNLIKQLRSIVAPSTTSVCEPAVQKTTRGRPSAKHKKSRKTHIDLNQMPPTEDPPTQEPESYTRYSFPRDPLMYEISNEPVRHNSYSFREQPTFNLPPIIDEIPNEFQQYVTNITDVEGDGNCGFRAIAVSLGYSEDYWCQIRTDLYNELLAHPQMYARIYEDDFNSLSHALNFRGTGFAPTEYWLIMPDTGFLIANRYGVIVNFLSKQGSSTCFPVMHGPEDVLDHRSVVIALVYGGYYVKVDLRSQHPMPRVLPLWRHRCSERSARWEIVYTAQLNAYLSANPRRLSENIEISDSY